MFEYDFEFEIVDAVCTLRFPVRTNAIDHAREYMASLVQANLRDEPGSQIVRFRLYWSKAGDPSETSEVDMTRAEFDEDIAEAMIAEQCGWE